MALDPRILPTYFNTFLKITRTLQSQFSSTLSIVLDYEFHKKSVKGINNCLADEGQIQGQTQRCRHYRVKTTSRGIDDLERPLINQLLVSAGRLYKMKSESSRNYKWTRQGGKLRESLYFIRENAG